MATGNTSTVPTMERNVTFGMWMMNQAGSIGSWSLQGDVTMRGLATPRALPAVPTRGECSPRFKIGPGVSLTFQLCTYFFVGSVSTLPPCLPYDISAVH